MCVGRNTAEPEKVKTFEDIFIGFTRNKISRFYVRNINPRSTKSGIITFLTNKAIHATHFVLFNSNNNTLSAKLNVPNQHAQQILSIDLYPPNVTCRKLYGVNSWNQRSTFGHSDYQNGW